mmetsp:Transcript_4277/g.11954  ORF Transcript_4277/g.11954 Transcript_4277/m.11954 type:complete len:245 (-) Transcript_4277:458-1192(-)
MVMVPSPQSRTTCSLKILSYRVAGDSRRRSCRRMRTAFPTSRVVAARPPATAMSGVWMPASSTSRQAASTARASSSSPSECRRSIAADRTVPMGFATPCPAISGAEPWMGSYRPNPDSLSDAEGSRPSDPGSMEASSVRISPNIFSVTITSKCLGSRSICIAAASTSMCSNCTSGNSSRITRSAVRRHSRDVASTLFLSTLVTSFRRLRAVCAAIRMIRSISFSLYSSLSHASPFSFASCRWPK